VPKIGDLPLGCAAVCSQSVWVQRIAVEAAVKGDETLLKQAMLLDPLTGAVLNPPEVWQLTDEMLIAQEKWLPQYGKAIAEAKERRGKGEWFETKENRGAARLKTKTVEEMAEDKDKMRRLAEATEKERVE
jgi:alpha-galactosidase